jgi:CTP synthase (UTP-ammonia lyase)
MQEDTMVHIGIIGDRDPHFPPHTAIETALADAATAIAAPVVVSWLATDLIPADPRSQLAPFAALWCAPGSPYRSFAGALRGITYARTENVPFIGTCAGFQHAILEYARNVLGFADAHSAEYDPNASHLFVSALACSLVGKTMQVHLQPRSRAAQAYGAREAREQYYCTFGLNPAYRALFETSALRIVGRDQDGEPRIVELAGHPFFIATLFVPQVSSSPDRPHPLIVAYLRAAMEYRPTPGTDAERERAVAHEPAPTRS